MARHFLRSTEMWRAPPNWSARDWFEEIQAEVRAATWEAERDFEPERGVPLEAFIQYRVRARAWSRYRQECTYARRAGVRLEDGEQNASAHSGKSLLENAESLWNCLRSLPEPERRLIESLYWDGKTEVEVARMLALSQPAISKRKRRILERLQRWMVRAEKSDSTGD